MSLPKYRCKVLIGEVEKATQELIADCCEWYALTLLALETDQCHVHVFVSAPPRLSHAGIANLLKGYRSRYLGERFPQLKRVRGKEHLWTQAYYVGAAGSISAEVIRRYIVECQGK